MKKQIVFLAFAFLAACQSQPGPVNKDLPSVTMRPTLDPSTPPDAPPPPEDTLKPNPKSAISGTLYLKSEISTLLSNARVGLYIKAAQQWNKIDEMSSDYQGHFSFTQKLYPGEYELRIMDPRFSGKLPLTIENKPLKGVIFEVSKN